MANSIFLLALQKEMLVLAECVCVMHKESQKSVAKIKIYLDSSDLHTLTHLTFTTY